MLLSHGADSAGAELGGRHYRGAARFDVGDITVGAIRALIGEVVAGGQVLNLVLALAGYFHRGLLYREGTLLLNLLVAVGSGYYHIALLTIIEPLRVSHRLTNGEGVASGSRSIVQATIPANRVLHFSSGQLVYRNELTLAVNSS